MTDSLPYSSYAQSGKSGTDSLSAISSEQYAATTSENEKIIKLVNEKKAGREFQLRKHLDWNENYELYRGKVKTNRLTQRQTVTVPLM
jgi:hypothetical protein